MRAKRADFAAQTLPWLTPAVNLVLPGGCRAGFGPKRLSRTRAPLASMLVLR
jgi:hypothetical protein